MFTLRSRSTLFSAALVCLMSSYSALATVVEVRTVLGDIQINLFDQTTPETVNNFLDYVDSGAYANNVVHRVESNFVVQLGGFQYNNSLPFDSVPTGTPVVNEPELSNRRGTVAMAKLGGNPNSATSQWFFNLSNNSGNLDAQNGGFSVFGQVIGDGMAVVDAIAALQTYNFGGALGSIPLIDYDGSSDIAEANLMLVTDIVVIDSATSTNTQLNPARNTSNDPSTPSGGDSGGGSAGWLLALLALVCLGRKKLNKTA